MQTLEIISLNIWQILISLCNLVLLFLGVKKFLYQPVRKVIAERKSAVNAEYDAAEMAKSEALKEKEEYAQRLEDAENEANRVIQNAVAVADQRSAQIVDDARKKADGILRTADTEAKLEQKRAQATIRQQIVDVSTELTEKMIGREINAEDHRDLIDSFLEKIGEDNDGNE